MFDKFMSLEEEKRVRIINAALKEFGLNGYRGAKTDNIAEEAGISKGLIFHYFKTKKGLFNFLLDYTMEISYSYLDKINMHEDILIRIKENTLMKMELFKECPHLFNFLITVSQKDEEDIKKESQDKINEFTVVAYEKMFSGLNYSLFKEDIEIENGINMIMWTIEGFSNKMMVLYKDKQIQEQNDVAPLKELDSYLEILRKALYK